jgi:hypothetical protein
MLAPEPAEIVIVEVSSGEDKVIATAFETARYFVVNARADNGPPMILKFTGPAAQNLRSFLVTLPEATAGL